MDSSLLINDIVERDTSSKAPAEFSDPTISSTGFPQHKRRWKSSAFKQRRGQQSDTQGKSGGEDTATPDTTSSIKQQESPSVSFDEVERQRIDRENRQRLDDMTPEQIAQAQQDILNGLNPALIQRLLQRSTIEDSNAPGVDTVQQSERPPVPPPEIKVADFSETTSTSATQHPKFERQPVTKPKKIADNYDEDAEPPQVPDDLFPITDPPKSTHFPAPPPRPDLDPRDPNFLQNLHEKYFPELPADPSKLAWMAPVPTPGSVADKESSYYPHPEIAISSLRFDFRGRFLPPRVSRSISSSIGLHHHGEAPEAAGYTVDELARLARSAVPAQRCIAFQTLGRVLYRLGAGEWGKSENDPIAMGVWNAVKKGRVLESLSEAAATEGGHRGSRAFATEALWLFEKGGWKEKFKGR